MILNNRILLFVFSAMVLLSSFVLSAQNDTIYYNDYWKVIAKYEASFFRPPVKKSGKLFTVEDYYINGNIQMRGTSSSAVSDLWEGKVIWYNGDGTISQQRTYKNNILNGEYITYDGKTKHIAYYDKGSFVSGKMTSPYGGGYYFQDKKGDSLLQVYYDNDRNGIRYENYSTTLKGNYLSIYYDEDGKLIGERKLQSNGYIKGLEVFYFYNPMRVQSIRYSPNGNHLITATFYSNGQAREKVVRGNKWSKEYFTKNGNSLGAIEYVIDQNYLLPYAGTLISFQSGSSKDLSESIRAMQTYREGKIIKDEVYYDDGKIKNVTDYEDGYKVLQVSYTEEGEENFRMSYKNNMPYTGTEVRTDRVTIYNDGELVEETLYYRNTTLPQKRITKTSEEYFDLKGNKLGELVIKTENGYHVPWEGERFLLGAVDGKITSISELREGVVRKRTDFRRRLVATDQYKTYKRIQEFGNNGYDKIRDMRYYSNGNLQSDITFENYNESKGVFYDAAGNELGVYDYQAKDGTLYEFFLDSDDVQLYEVYEKETLVISKEYVQKRNTDYRLTKPFLIQDIDIDCCATFYDEDGDFIGKLIFKDRKPWSGIMYDRIDRSSYVMKGGKRNGDFKKYDFNEKVVEEGVFVDGKKEGLFNYYNYYGVVKRTENYKNGELDGDTSYYDDKGNFMTKLEYLKGKPTNGTRFLNFRSYKYSNKESYKNGLLIERVIYSENGKNVSTYINGVEDKTIAYYEDSDFKRLQYSNKNGYLDGEVIRYDKEGKEQHRAQLRKGELVSGTILLVSNDNNKAVSHVEVFKNDEYVKMVVKDVDGVSIFTAEEKSIKGSEPKYLSRLNISMNYLDAYRLY